MKKLDKFILKSYAGPYVLSFFIAEFVLIMQFLWKYIDDILGKGFTMFDILELVLYYGASIIPMALPISILLASVMVFGDISEKYELSSMKSAGISLLRIMKPAIYLSVFTCLFSIFASNYLKPVATYQFKKRFDLIRKQKSTLSIEEGIFNNEFNSFVIRVGKKAENQKDVKDILIYDQTMPDKSLINLIKADSAEMYATDDGKYFVMNLKKGEQYQELDRNKIENGKIPIPLVRTSFNKWSKIIDMSGFYLSESDLNISRNREDMLNSFQLMEQIDSMNANIKRYSKKSQCTYTELTVQKALLDSDYAAQLKRSLEKPKVATLKKNDTPIPVKSGKSIVAPKKQKITVKNDNGTLNPENAMQIIKMQKKAVEIKKNNIKNIPSLPLKLSTPDKKDSVYFKRIDNYTLGNGKSFFETFDSITQKSLIAKSLPFVSANLDIANSAYNNIDHSFYQKQVYILRLGQQYSFAIVCILFLFIGAPLGSIIRKGGFGYPLLIAILFYILFIITTIVGEKLLKSETIMGWFGAWLPCLVLLPFSIYFTYQALQDVRVIWLDKIETKVLTWINKRKEKNNAAPST